MHWEDLEGSGGEGGGIGMGNTCKPMAVSFQCMTKSTTIKNNNNKKFFLNKINKKNPPANVGDTGLIPGPGRFYMLLGANSMHRHY